MGLRIFTTYEEYSATLSRLHRLIGEVEEAIEIVKENHNSARVYMQGGERAERVEKRHIERHAGKQVRPRAHGTANREPARRPAARHDAAVAFSESARARDDVGGRLFLVQAPPLRVPGRAALAAAPHAAARHGVPVFEERAPFRVQRARQARAAGARARALERDLATESAELQEDRVRGPPAAVEGKICGILQNKLLIFKSTF